MKLEELKPVFTFLFVFGVILFAVGVLAAFFGYFIPSPIGALTFQTVVGTYYSLFINWLTILGIVLGGVGSVSSFMERKKK